MNKFIVLLLVAFFTVAIAGCVSQTEYDKMLDAKASIEQHYAQLQSQISVLQSAQADFEKLAEENISLKNAHSVLIQEKEQLTQTVGEMQQAVNSLKEELNRLKTAALAVEIQ